MNTNPKINYPPSPCMRAMYGSIDPHPIKIGRSFQPTHVMPVIVTTFEKFNAASLIIKTEIDSVLAPTTQHRIMTV
jgi:hypothetical protein